MLRMCGLMVGFAMCSSMRNEQHLTGWEFFRMRLGILQNAADSVSSNCHVEFFPVWNVCSLLQLSHLDEADTLPVTVSVESDNEPVQQVTALMRLSGPNPEASCTMHAMREIQATQSMCIKGRH